MTSQPTGQENNNKSLIINDLNEFSITTDRLFYTRAKLLQKIIFKKKFHFSFQLASEFTKIYRFSPYTYS